MEKSYVSPLCKLTIFKADDVVTASTWNLNGDYGQDWFWGQEEEDL